MYTYVVTYTMVPRQTIFRATAPAQLSSLHSADCSLLRLSSHSWSAKISNLQFTRRLVVGLFCQKSGGWGTLKFTRLASALAKFFAAYHIHVSSFFSWDRRHFCATASRLLQWFQWVAHSFNVNGGGRGCCSKRYGPGTSLTERTGSIPDTARTLATACKTSACHGKRAVLWKKNYDLSSSTSCGNGP